MPCRLPEIVSAVAMGRIMFQGVESGSLIICLEVTLKSPPLLVSVCIGMYNPEVTQKVQHKDLEKDVSKLIREK